MGGCLSGNIPDMESHNAVNKEMQESKVQDSNVIKLLFLGAGSSGKSTIFKQLNSIHGEGYTTKDRKIFKEQIHEQIINDMKRIVQRLEDDWEFDEENFLNEFKEYKISDEHKSLVPWCLSIENDRKQLDPVTIQNLNILWQDSAIQNAYTKKNLLSLPESTRIFLNRIEEIGSDKYLPSLNDILLIRNRTTGMNNKTFVIEGKRFLICDVGGQRSERRKWAHFFDNVTAVLFVVGLSCYDEAIFEDETANAMEESLTVFGEHINSQHFQEAGFILFLNKKDLFDLKIKEIPLTVWTQEYTGDGSAEDGVRFIESKFQEQNEQDEDRVIYSHVTTALDKDNVKTVFQDTQHIVINLSLAKSGLLN